MMTAPRDPGWLWALRTAWRDCRGQRRLLLLFSLSVVCGIASLVAIRSFRVNLLDYIQTESKTLLGADMVWRSQRPFDDDTERLASKMGGRQTEEMRFRSMGYFPRLGASRFVEVRALEGAFPLYGDWETTPTGVRLEDPAPGEAPMAIVEEGLMTQLGLRVGEEMDLGQTRFRIAAALERVAGESELSGFFAPRIFVQQGALAGSGLLGVGSLVDYRLYFAVEPENADALFDKEAGWRADLREEGVRVTTSKDRQERLTRNFARLFSFLNLIGLVALLLGALGIGGAVQVYLREKLASVALWRCLGAPLSAAYRIYWLQILALGLAGAIAGAVLGVSMQMVLPQFIRDFLPADVKPTVVWGEVLFGASFGTLLAVLCGWLPLLAIRRVTPLAVLRQDVLEESLRSRSDPAKMVLQGLLAGLIVFFCWWQMDRGWQGLAFAGGFAAVVMVLGAMAVALRFLLRRLVRPRLPYLWRLALSSVYRPQNRTVFLIITLGTGVFLIHLLAVARQSLLEEIRLRDLDASPNLILLDVQHDQLEPIKQLMEGEGFAVQDVLPIITMRLAGIQGRPLSEWRSEQDPRTGEGKVSNWIFTWEFRVTYRDEILDNEALVGGEWISRHDAEPPIPISLSKNILDDIPVGVGDRLTWDVQGLPVETVVASIRDVDWELGRQNFNILFPRGWIEQAPVMYAVATRAGNRAEVQQLQSLMRGEFANVSLVDLSLVYETLAMILGRAEFVVQFLAAFTIATGLLVLVAAVLTSRYQRRRESALLRTLGASGHFVMLVVAIEYAVIGLLAGGVGVLLSWGGGWALVRFVFEGSAVIPWMEGVAIIAGAGLLTAAAGTLLVRSAARAPVVTVLRQEA